MSVRYIRACLIQDVECLRNRIISQVICKREQVSAHVKDLDDSDYIRLQMLELECIINNIVTDYLDLELTNEETD